MNAHLKPTLAEIAAAKEELSWLPDLPAYIALAKPFMTHPSEFEFALTLEMRAQRSVRNDRVEETAHAIMVLALAT